MSQPNDQRPIELHMFSPLEADEVVELLVVTAHYHRTAAPLGPGHTVNFGRPWLDASECKYGLVSLPYLDGPSLEDLEIASRPVAKLARELGPCTALCCERSTRRRCHSRQTRLRRPTDVASTAYEAPQSDAHSPLLLPCLTHRQRLDQRANHGSQEIRRQPPVSHYVVNGGPPPSRRCHFRLRHSTDVDSTE